MPAKPAQTVDALTPRDRAICDGFISGTSRKQLAAQFDLTPARIGQILQQPGAVVYLLTRMGNTRTLVAAKAIGAILDRMEWGTTAVRLTDLIDIFKAVAPKEVALTITDRRAEAEAIAAEIGKADDPAVVAQIEADLLISQQPTR